MNPKDQQILAEKIVKIQKLNNIAEFNGIFELVMAEKEKTMSEARTNVLEEIKSIITNDIGYALRDKPMPEVEDIINILESLKKPNEKDKA